MSLLLAHALSPRDKRESEIATVERGAKIELAMARLMSVLSLGKDDFLMYAHRLVEKNSTGAPGKPEEHKVTAPTGTGTGLHITLDVKCEGNKLYSNFNFNGFKIRFEGYTSKACKTLNLTGTPGDAHRLADRLHTQLRQCIEQACFSDSTSVQCPGSL